MLLLIFRTGQCNKILTRNFRNEILKRFVNVNTYRSTLVHVWFVIFWPANEKDRIIETANRTSTNIISIILNKFLLNKITSAAESDTFWFLFENCKLIIYCRISHERNMRGANVFGRVCPSVHGGGGGGVCPVPWSCPAVMGRGVPWSYSPARSGLGGTLTRWPTPLPS